MTLIKCITLVFSDGETVTLPELPPQEIAEQQRPAAALDRSNQRESETGIEPLDQGAGIISTI